MWAGTAEGDFYVLILQTARYLLKSYRAAKAGEALSPLMAVLGSKANAIPPALASKNQVTLEYLDAVMAARVLEQVSQGHPFARACFILLFL